MNTKLPLLLLLFAGQCMPFKTFAQHNLTIVYDITINKTKKASGIEETYNGGTKAVFISNKKARVRLVSMMRVQSTFFEYDSTTLKQAVLLKESGTSKYRSNLSAADWKDYNSKYEGAACEIKGDSIDIAGYKCRKAVINLSSGDSIEVYYTDSIKAINSFIEPAFSCIPGVVLQYAVQSEEGTVTFKASQVSNELIEKNIFVIPRTGVQARKYAAAKKGKE
jgi:GLPGLI family protein